ncbi:hypothetical protein [Pantanalinema sp. GBBB05]|uniref:hypothetical protein n=1 Tax=Pantanalinema sp. GBBB05 TaxID=2604139 RepID=UPI001DB00695|nr:hypothetical protein [Pantanalinema sp. GBBB05]
MPRGENPNSLANLTYRDGRTPKWEGRKKHEVRVSDEGWEGAQAASQAVGCTGVSEMLEKLGRGELQLVNPNEPEQ